MEIISSNVMFVMGTQEHREKIHWFQRTRKYKKNPQFSKIIHQNEHICNIWEIHNKYINPCLVQ